MVLDNKGDDDAPKSRDFSVVNEADEEEYELLPQREILELKDELQKLKRFDITPSKKLQVSMVDLNSKLDRLLAIFEDAMHEVKVEGAFGADKAKLNELSERISKVADQQAEIAAGTLLLVDLVKEINEKIQNAQQPPAEPEAPAEELPMGGYDQSAVPSAPPGRMSAPPMSGGLPPPAGRPGFPAGGPPLPPPRRRGIFG